jgi:hypothetical protein
MKLALLVLLAAAALYGLHRLAVWAEGRGFIYYRKRRGSSGAASRAFLEVQSLLEPAQRHVLEEKARDRVEEQDKGGPPRGSSPRQAAERRD